MSEYDEEIELLKLFARNLKIKRAARLLISFGVTPEMYKKAYEEAENNERI